MKLPEGFVATGVTFEDGRATGIRGHSENGASVIERARLVIGADGLHSAVAQAVEPQQYHDVGRSRPFPQTMT